jgi:hypothetical protein
MSSPYVSPVHLQGAFNCPLCGAFAQVIWYEMFRLRHGQSTRLDTFSASYCTHCQGWLYWNNGQIVVPNVSIAPTPSDDLPDHIKSDYAEAAAIAGKSPRGAAALLRLCLQKLCKHLGEKGKNIDEDIGSLVKKGLDVRVQQALDTVRVIGNEAVHPGEMNVEDDNEIVGQLFVLLNAITNDLITQPRLRNELYEKLPEKKLAAIAARDGRPAPEKS